MSYLCVAMFCKIVSKAHLAATLAKLTTNRKLKVGVEGKALVNFSFFTTKKNMIEKRIPVSWGISMLPQSFCKQISKREGGREELGGERKS